MAKKIKKYEINTPAVTIDFRKALTGSDERLYHEKWGNSFTHLAYVATLPASVESSDICLQELRDRAYNYMTKALSIPDYVANRVADLFREKLLTYRQAS